MISLAINENQTIWLALIGSLLIHGLLFAFSGPTFIQQAQYSVQPSAQMVEVSIEAKDFTASLDSSALPQNDNVSIQNDIGQKQVTRSISGVRGKANPNYFQNPAPEYPELAKQMRQEGLIILAVDVDREGLPIKVEINQSSGFRLLDQAALKAVGHWKFQPGRMGDIPVESTAIVPIRFRLEN